jgi:hypothetical protein
MQKATMRVSTMRVSTMQVSAWLLSWSLLAAMADRSAFCSANDAALTGRMGGDAAGSQPPVRLAGVNGHDSVGGLMPLPLWPRGAARAQEATPAPSWKRGARHCCGVMRHSNKARQ